ncbi:hypothetical protein [Hyphococcus sp.]|jgi:hypothetical protein|uniref:hypothetical protein n=1 Tax=Hyphococcus sp. TaxID=2038636 RepID=UPI003D14E8A2
MSVIPCDNDDKERRKKVDEYVEHLKLHAHEIGGHELSDQEFYDSGFFRAAMERIRGQNSAKMREKREFVQHVLNYLQDRSFIEDWSPAGSQNRYDYDVTFSDGRNAAIELKGCMDGNNTTIFERPNHAQEFLVWSVCANKLSNMARNAWSGLHTRLSAQIIENNIKVDGVIIWDWICGSRERPCPKLRDPNFGNRIQIGPYNLPPPCIYILPATVPSARNNPKPNTPQLSELRLLNAFHECFGGSKDHINYVNYEIRQQGQEKARKTSVTRGGEIKKTSRFTPIRRK